MNSQAMSERITGSRFGRITFTTTSSPLFRRAAWTWATEAEASGSRSKRAKTCSIFAPSCSSMRLTASSGGKGGTLSCSQASSLAMSSGSRSRRVERIWPNLMKIGPRSCSARRRRAAGQFQLAPRQPAPGQGGTEQAQPPGQHRQFEDQVVQAVADDDALDAQEAAESEELHASGLVFWLRRPTRASRRSRASFSWSSSAKRASASCWPTSVRLSSAR